MADFVRAFTHKQYPHYEDIDSCSNEGRFLVLFSRYVQKESNLLIKEKIERKCEHTSSKRKKRLICTLILAEYAAVDESFGCVEIRKVCQNV